jgi:hypothetical protein
MKVKEWEGKARVKRDEIKWKLKKRLLMYMGNMCRKYCFSSNKTLTIMNLFMSFHIIFPCKSTITEATSKIFWSVWIMCLHMLNKIMTTFRSIIMKRELATERFFKGDMKFTCDYKQGTQIFCQNQTWRFFSLKYMVQW